MSVTTDKQPRDERQLEDLLAAWQADERARRKRRTIALVGGLFVLVASVAALILALTNDGGAGTTGTPAITPDRPAANAGSSAMPGEAGRPATQSMHDDDRASSSGATASRTVRVELGEMYVKPSVRTITAGRVTFAVRNVGEIEHELIVGKVPLKMEAPGMPAHGGVGMTEHMDAGAREKLSVDLKPGTYVLFCNVPGHYAAGQRTRFKVRED